MRDVEVALRVVERRLAQESFRLEVLGTGELLLGLDLIGMRLCQRLLRARQADFAQLPDLCLGLRDGGLRLRHRRALVRIVQQHQHVAAPDVAALGHRNSRDPLRDQRADRYALRGHDAAARDDRLDEFAARDLRDVCRRAQD